MTSFQHRNIKSMLTTNKENNVNHHFMDFNNLNHLQDDSIESLSIADSDFDTINFLNSVNFNNARTSTPFKLPSRTPSKWSHHKGSTFNDSSFNNQENKEIKSLKSKIADLEKKLSESKRLNEQYEETIKNLQSEINSTLNNNKSSDLNDNYEKIIEEHSLTITNLNQEIKKLNDENEKLKKENENLKEENENLKEEIEEKDKKIDEYRDEIEGMVDDLKRIADSNEKEQKKESTDDNFCFMDMISSVHNDDSDNEIEDNFDYNEHSFVSIDSKINNNDSIADLLFNNNNNNNRINEKDKHYYEDEEYKQLKDKIEIEKQKIEDRIKEIELKCESFSDKEKQIHNEYNQFINKIKSPEEDILPKVSSGINELLNQVNEIKKRSKSSSDKIITTKKVILALFVLIIGISWPFFYFPCVKRMLSYPYNIYPT